MVTSMWGVTVRAEEGIAEQINEELAQAQLEQETLQEEPDMADVVITEETVEPIRGSVNIPSVVADGTDFCLYCTSNQSFTYDYVYQSAYGQQHIKYQKCDKCGKNQKGSEIPDAPGERLLYYLALFWDLVFNNGNRTEGVLESHTKSVEILEVNDSTHQRITTCGYCTYEASESHTTAYSGWVAIDGQKHKRTKQCGKTGSSKCDFTEEVTAEHVDADDNGACDACGYDMSRFSVTVPTSLGLTMAADGTVSAATTGTVASIQNHSTGLVKVSQVEFKGKNDWQLVSYDHTNMAEQYVDSKLIAFQLNDELKTTGKDEKFTLTDWTINPKSALPLTYDAKISATSTAIEEQVMEVIFTVQWAE